jgi:CDP-diacylglycerol--glycerol-3-phosphate 3-phosphatidyltransferase
MSHGVVPKQAAEGTRLGLAPVARRISALGVSANAVTVLGGALTCIGAALLAMNMPLAALVVLAVGTLADTLDGQVAKAAGGGTAFGAFLDSTVDRLSDAALFIGTVLLAATTGQPALVWWGLVALTCSFLVSYVRAKGESMGVGASVGPAPREARIVIFLLGLAAWALFGLELVFAAGVLIVALLSSVTLLMRVVHVGRQLSTKGR